MSQETNLTKWKTLLQSLPKWARITVVLLVLAASGLLILFNLNSCSTVRVVGNDGNSSVQVRQHALDSMQINVQFLPVGKS